MAPASLLITLLLALAIAITAKSVLERKPPIKIKLPLTKRYNLANYNFVERDRHRLNSLRRRAGNQDDSDLGSTIKIPAIYRFGTYAVIVGVGQPPTNYNLLLDSGSANTWIGANTSHVYTPTSTSHVTGNNVAFGYITGGFNGYEVTDQITLGPGLVIPSQSMGVAKKSSGINPQAGFDGILGVGPEDLTEGSLSLPDGSIIPGDIPTVIDSLSALKLISAIMSVYFPPFDVSKYSVDPSQIDGEVSFGGIDTSKFIGEITYTPITSTYPSSRQWGIDASVSYANLPLLSMTAGGVDTGSSEIVLASEAYNAYQAATGAVLDSVTGLLTITLDQYNRLQNLHFNIAGVDFILIPNAQIWPRSLNIYIGGIDTQIYLVVRNLGTHRGSGLDFILGVPFIQRYYVVFDAVNKQVGFAQTPFTNAITN